MSIVTPREPYVIDLTPKQAYEQIKDYFSRPGAKLAQSEDKSGCYYRHPDDGRACAVGCLIPDGYVSHTTSGIVDDLIARRIISVPNEDTELFLTRAQIAHDNSSSVEELLQKLDFIINHPVP